MAFLNTVRNRAIEPWNPNPNTPNKGWYDPTKNTTNPYLGRNTRYGAAGSYGGGDNPAWNTGNYGNSFLGTFLNLAKSAIPYTTDVIKKRRQDKIDQLLQTQDTLKQKYFQQTPSNLDEYGRTPEEAAYQMRAKASIRRGIAGGGGADTLNTPPTKDFLESKEPTEPTPQPTPQPTPESVTPTDPWADYFSKTSGLYHPETGKTESTGSTDTTPGQGNPLVNIDEQGNWVEPTEEQYASLYDSDYDPLNPYKKKPTEGGEEE